MLSFKHELLTTFILLLAVNSLNAQAIRKINEAFEYGTLVTGDWVFNMNGGIKKGNTYIGLESLTLMFDTQKAGLWKKGTFFLHGLNAHGTGPSANLIGDLQVLSNIEASDYTGLYEYWYMQQFNNFSILFGQHDLNTEFAGTKYGGTFINSSFGIIPSISLNIPVSIYPVAAPCILFKYNTNKKFGFKFAIYDGDPGDFETNRYDLKWSISSGQGFLIIQETQYNLIENNNLTGTYKFGVYYHTGFFKSYTDTLKTQHGNYGLYFIADQALFSRSLNAGRGLCFFIQMGVTPPKNNMVKYCVGGGFRYHGIFPYRYYDELGIAFSHISISNNYSKLYNTLDNETDIEMTYKFQFSKGYSIQPSIQYVCNPGVNKEYDNCFVGILRFSLEY